MARIPVLSWLASSEQAGYEGARAGDGLALPDQYARWATANASVPVTLRADVGASAPPATWYQLSPSMYAANQDPVAWTFEGSVDGSTGWTVLDTKAAQSFPYYECKAIAFTNTVAYRFYRLNVSANGGTLTSVSELVIGSGTPPSRLFGWSPVNNSGSGSFRLGSEFYPTVDGFITRLTYLEQASAQGTITLRLEGPTGTVLATVTDTAVNGRAGWREIPITPVAVTAGTHYEVSHYVNTYFAMTAQSFASARTFNDLVMVANGSGTVRGVTFNPRYASGDNPTVNTGSAYGTGVVFVRTVETEPVVVKTYESYLELASRGIPKVKTAETYLELASRGIPRVKTVESYLEVLHRADAPPRTDITQFPIISEIRAEDHATATVLIDRAGEDWVQYGQSSQAVSVAASATPNGKSALTFGGGVGWSRLNDPGMMYQYSDLEMVRASTTFNAWQGDYGPQNAAGTTGQFSCQTFTGTPEWWAAKLTSAKVLTSYAIQHSGNGSNGRNARDWKFQGSNDSTTGGDGTWVDLDTRTGQQTDALTTYTFTNSTPYRWYRIRVTAINGGQMWFATRIELGTLNLLGLQMTSAEQWLVVKSTAATAGHPAKFNDVGGLYYPHADTNIYTGWGAAGRAAYVPTLAVLNQWRIYRLRRAGGTTSEYIDGVLQLNQTSGTFWRQPQIGGFAGQIAASIVVKEALSPADAAFMTTYLRDAYFTLPSAPPGIFIGWGTPRGVGGPPVVDNDYAIAVKAGSPSMYLQMNEGTGTTASDSSGNGRNATLTAPATLAATTSMVGAGAMTVGGGYAVVPYGSWMNAAAFTWEAVIYSTSTSVAAWQHVLDRDSSAGRVFQFAVLGNGAMQLVQTAAGAKFGASVFAAAGSVAINRKVHVAFSYDAGVVRLFVNGVQVATDTGYALSGASPLAIGLGYGGASGTPIVAPFSGQIDEVVFTPRALSAAELAARVPLAVPPMPAAIANAGILWMRGRDLGANGAVASVWPDASPAARTVTYNPVNANATVAAASTPKGGKSVAFPGGPNTGAYFSVNSTALPTSRDGEVWLVVKSNDASGSSNGWCKFGGDGQENHYGYGGSVYEDTGCASRQSYGATGITSWHIHRVQVSGTTRTVWRDSTVVWGPSGVTPFWRQNPNIGGALSYRFNGNIAEVIQFSRALTTTEAAEVMAYLTAEHM